MYRFEEIKTVHLEITDRCNAACPMCARNINGGEDNDQLPDTELTLCQIKQIFLPEFVKQLDRLYMCGNYGDPIAARDTLEAFKYFREHNDSIELSMHTNGSAKKSDWWRSLASVIGTQGYVVFGIDGLEDTNHLYRQNTQWNRIMENAEAFISAGGRARWDYIVFAHNEHQVEEAESISKSLGFERFRYKKSARFYSSASGITKEHHQAANRKGLTTLLKPPQDPRYRNSVIDDLGKISSGEIKYLPSKKNEIIRFPQIFRKDSLMKKPMEKLWDGAQIRCKVQEEKSVYISAEGIVQPCCWTAGQMYVWYWTPKGGQIWNLIDAVGKENLNALNKNIRDIINGEYFQDKIPNSWKKSSCADGKMAICAKTCGTTFDAFSEQFK